ncbi:uncharacterized protein VP01_9067g1, partial [Puccinia sorghi]
QSHSLLVRLNALNPNYQHLTGEKLLTQQSCLKISLQLRHCPGSPLTGLGLKGSLIMNTFVLLGKFGDTSKPGILLVYQLGMHNWCILLQGGNFEHFHDVVFNKADFPGDSLFSPADGSTNLDITVLA